MKKTSSLILFVILIFSASAASFAQRAGTSRSIPVAPAEFVQFDTISAFTDGQGTLVRWQMTSETGNLGFFVYRVGDHGLELVNEVLVLGSVSKVAERTALGETYELFDEAGRVDTRYVIQSVASDGRRVVTRATYAQFSTNFEADTGHPKSYYTNKARFKNRNVNRNDLVLPSELQTIVTGSQQAPDPAMQRVVVTQPGVKIGVKTEGMYRVTRAELEAAGFDVNSDPANWRLFVDGNEQAIIVGDGGSYVDFYGKGLDVRETDTRIYYLIADAVPGKRVITKFLGSIGGNAVSNNYRLASLKKERTSYDLTILNGDIENYFGRAVLSSGTDIPFNLTSVDQGGLDAVVTVKMQGFVNAAHAVRATLNGYEIGIITGTNKNSFSADFTVPAEYLEEGPNTLNLASTLSSDESYFDSVKVNYSRKYVAAQNSVLFFTPGYRRMDVGGFTSPNIRVFDTTLDGNAQLITDLPIVQNGSTYSVKMPSNRPAVFFAVEDSALLHPASIAYDNPSDLASPGNAADMIIISYSSPDFMASAETWANYRRSTAGGNFTVKVVDVADIFDEFSYGAHSSDAIQQFLEYTYNNWQTPRPRYVLILGDASRDPRNYEGFGDFDLVPSKSVDLIFGPAASDEALGDFTHDGLAEIAMGRVPARTTSVISTMLNKTQLFETPALQSLDRGAVFAFDLPFGFDFNSMSQALAHQLPSRVPITFINRGLPEPNPNNQSDPAAHDNLINAINTGKYIVNFSGHGTTGLWGSTDFFSVTDVPHLTNATRPSIFTMLTCLNGYFVRPDADSLSEALVKAPNGGAAAAWASTADTTPDYQYTMAVEFYHQLGLGNIHRLGDLVIQAKSTIAGSDVGYSWVLLGDPAMQVIQSP